MFKKIGIAAVAVVAALVLGATVIGTTPRADADVNEVIDVHCLLLQDSSIGYTTVGFQPCTTPLTSVEVQDLADVLGDEDGTLEAGDFSAFEQYDANQLSEACTSPAFLCTNLIFVFVNDEESVTLDTPAGLTSIQAGGAETDAVCDTDNDATTPDGDFDCSDTVASNGDGVVVFQVYNFNADRGDTKTVNVRQEDVPDSVDINMVGSPNDVVLTLVESLIETNGSLADANECAAETDVTDAIDPPNATLAFAIVYDEDDRELAMVGVEITVQPPADNPDIATLGVGDVPEEITGDTKLSLLPEEDGAAPIAYYRVVCGGMGTGETTIKAQIDDGDADTVKDDDTSTQDLTVGGAPSALALTAQASTIKCDGSEKSTVTVKVTDSDGNDVADGVPVNFSVVALGTADPINTVTKDGQASTVVTPLSNSSAGVTVIVTVGDSSIASPVQQSVRVDCALPLATQPTLAPPVPVAPITPPDTGNGGYLGQDGGSFPMWTLIALVLGSLTLVAGGAVARRAAK
ncbi:MAG TPA: hypothetical protein VJP07_01175 [Dehalococcoidia bacterium]|nr:hypothetical protein [Dehalococcoidia bacterium]